MGGAAGHMKHPFDLPAVETGEDLVGFFETAADWVLENTPALKIDGVNASFKLIGSDRSPNGKEFALDRGSAKPIDIEGITTARVGERWPEEHGMYSATKILLDIFNRALWHEDGTYIKEELEQLGVWDDPTVIFNTEFVLKNLNVKEYKTNFIALHGINKFSWATKRRRASKEIAYSRDALESLRDKVAPFAKAAKNLQGEDLDMEVYTSVPVAARRGETDEVVRADFSNTLNSIFPIHQRYGEPPIERSLGNWLAGADNPRGAKISLITGRKVGALSKEIYKVVLNTTEPLADLLGEDEESIKLATDGAIFYHATRLLGNDVLATLTAGEDFGPVNEEEGIVLRDRIAFGTDDPVKITGNFILGGEEGKLAQKARAPAKETEKAGKIIALFPGGFKPPHAGHFELAKRYAQDPQVSKVLMLIGPTTRSSQDGAVRITKESSIHIISEFYKQFLGDKVVLEDSPGGEENPMRAAYKWIEEVAQPGEIYTLAASSKDPKRAQMFAGSHKCPEGKYCKEGVEVVVHPVDTKATIYKGRTDELNGREISASIMREDLANGDKENFITNLPPEARSYIGEIFDYLGGVVKKTTLPQSSLDDEEQDMPLSEKKINEDELDEDALFTPPHPSKKKLKSKKEKEKEKKLKSKKGKDEDIEEMSSMSGGNVEGHAQNTFLGLNVEAENEKEKTRSKVTGVTKEETNYNMREEQQLRKYIRSLISKKTEIKNRVFKEEQKLRQVIRNIISEAAIEDTPTRSTGINKLVGTLKIILPTIERAYKGLTTSIEQRESFKKHITKAILDTLSPQDTLTDIGDGGEEGVEELPIEEPAVAEPDPAAAEELAEAILSEQDPVGADPRGIDVGVADEKDPEDDVFKSQEDRQTEEEEEEEAKAAAEEEEKVRKEEGFEDIEGIEREFPKFPSLDPTGRDEAVDIYKKVIDAVVRTYRRLHAERDKEHFKEYLVTNMLLYFDKWEADIGGEVPADVTTASYEKATAEKAQFSPGGAEPMAEEIKKAIMNTLAKKL